MRNDSQMHHNHHSACTSSAWDQWWSGTLRQCVMFSLTGHSLCAASCHHSPTQSWRHLFLVVHGAPFLPQIHFCWVPNSINRQALLAPFPSYVNCGIHCRRDLESSISNDLANTIFICWFTTKGNSKVFHSLISQCWLLIVTEVMWWGRLEEPRISDALPPSWPVVVYGEVSCV